jgi:hypothetical protein
VYFANAVGINGPLCRGDEVFLLIVFRDEQVEETAVPILPHSIAR